MNLDLNALQTEDGLEIAPGVRVRLRSLADYRQNPENPVSHTPHNLSTVVESIHKVGAARSGLAADGTIYAGNLTSEAMALAGIEGIIEITTDGTKWVMVNRPDLTPEQRKQAAHGDQWSAMLAEMNVDQLLADIEAGVNLDGIYSDFDLEAILGEALVETGEVPEAQIDKGAELAEKYGVKVGQVWTLGEHRLAVGDCTDKAVVDAVMRGEGADCTATDPPYGVGVDYGEFEDTPENVRVLIKDVMPIIFEYLPAALTPGVPAMWDYPRPAWVGAWVHPAPAGGCPWGFVGNNPILFYGKDPYLQAGKGRRPDSVVMGTDRQGEANHPTPKPIKVWEWLVERLTPEKGMIVFDPLAGSGTTGIACERLGRQARMIEISEAYCAVTIQRWVDLTNKEPKLLQ